MRVHWKVKVPAQRWIYIYFLAGYLVLSVHFQRKGHPEMWVILGIQIALLFLFFRFSHRLPFGSQFVDFDGERIDFSGNTGGPWRLADVDSVMIQDRLIQIRVYRAGGMGDEFTARAELMPAEAWEKLTALCRRIEAAIPANGDAGLGEARRRAKELDDHPETGCSWEEIKTPLGR